MKENTPDLPERSNRALNAAGWAADARAVRITDTLSERRRGRSSACLVDALGHRLCRVLPEPPHDKGQQQGYADENDLS